MKKIVSVVILICLSIVSFAQSNDTIMVKAVLTEYNSALEKLDVTGTKNLFSTNSRIYESGSSEGNYEYYLEHHLTPEFKEFKSFKFSNYKVEIQVDGNYAFAIEIYNYTIIVAKANTEVNRKGVSTSVLNKVNGEWKIIISHNSSRK